MTPLDPQAMRDAWRLQNRTARKRPLARQILLERLSQHNPYPVGSDAPRVAGGTIGSPVERTVLRRARILANLEQITEDANTISEMNATHERFLDYIIEGRDWEDHDPDPDADISAIPLCYEGQAGKEGTIVWGDVTCAMPALKRGMCQHHYDAWRRHRAGLGIDTSRDHEPA